MIARLTLLVLGLALTACVESSAAQSGRLSRGSSPELEAAIARVRAELSMENVRVGDVERTYYMHRPISLNGPAPLLFVLHGGNGTALQRAAQTGFNAIADREGFVVVYPQGLGNGWNDGRDTSFLLERQQNADDVAFFRVMIDRLIADGLADPDRVYLSGGSNGGMMSFRLACEATDTFAAVVTMVANLPEPLAAQCRPTRPLPLLMMHGTADPLMPPEGGSVAAFTQSDQGRVISAENTISFWLRNNGCGEDVEVGAIEDRDPADGIRTETRTWTSCRDGATVVAYRMVGAGHGLPGRSSNKPELNARVGGRPTNDFDSSEATWSFVHQFRR